MELRAEDLKAYKNYMRMPPDMFDEILARIGPTKQRQHTHFRPPLPAGLKLAITRRYLAAGDLYTSLMYAFRVPTCTISLIIPEVCAAIIREYRDECIICPGTPDEWREVSKLFKDRWNIPHALGAMDGKHVAIQCPHNSGMEFHNYKGFFSIILLALVDADYKYLWVSVGASGSS